MRLETIDDGREFDWGNTSADYGQHRLGYPDTFYDVLAALGVGRPGQVILDLGTGTGELARAFSKRGATVIGVDIAANQIAVAHELARRDGIEADFRVGAVEAVEFADASFNVISAGQSWMYFDTTVMIPKVLRLLNSDGCLLLTHLLWLPRQDPIAERSEALVLKHNPDWKGAGYSGDMPQTFPWSHESFDLHAFITIHQRLPFTRESWRGRIRACRGIGATLSPAEVARFDAEHRELLQSTAPESFEVLHQMTAHVYRTKR